MTHIVLGMHKSGTSLVSQLLHTSGIKMVDHERHSLSYDKGNKWERESTKQINHLILRSQGFYSLDIPLSYSKVPSEIRKQMRETISKIAQVSSQWGFKDPRTCITYPLWASELPNHKVIAVYRSPLEVWSRYVKQGSNRKENLKITAFKFLRAWCRYNLNILNIIRTSKDNSILINYSDLMSSDKVFNSLENFVGVSLTDKRDPSLYRDKAEDEKSIVYSLGRLNLLYGQPHPRKIFELLERHSANPSFYSPIC